MALYSLLSSEDRAKETRACFESHDLGIRSSRLRPHDPMQETPTQSRPASGPHLVDADAPDVQATTGGRAMTSAIAAFVTGAAIIVVVTAFALTQSPPRLVRIGAPGVKALSPSGASLVGTAHGETTVCQSGEVLPAGISAIRVSIWAFYGAHVHVMAYSGSTLLTQGSRGPNWTGDSVTVPVRPLSHNIAGARVCIQIKPNTQVMQLLGPATKPQQAAVSLARGFSPAHPTPAGERAAPGRLAIEYLAAGHGSWWSRIPAVAQHLGLGRFYSGTWIVLLIAALMVIVGVLAVRLTLRELR
jgi:hypothetical protein